MKCLLCASVDVAQPANSLGSFRTRSESCPHHDDDNDNDGSRDAHLWSTFVLTQMFNLSSEECQKLLETGGIEGDNWIRKICGRCVKEVQLFRRHHEERQEIERKMESIRKAVHEKLPGLCVEDNWNNGMMMESGKGGESLICSVPGKIRIYFQAVFHTLSCVSGPTSSQSNVGGKLDTEYGHNGRGIMEPPAAGEKTPAALRRTLQEDAEHVAVSEAKRTQRNNVPARSEPTRDYIEVECAEDMVGETTTTLSISNVRPLNLTVANREVRESAENVADEDDDDDDMSDNVESPSSKSSAALEKCRHPCKTCGKCFPSKWHLTRHLIMHTGEKSFVCRFCRKGFGQKYHLKRHYAKTHTNKKFFFCNVCNKGFFFKSDLANHIPVHSDNRPYKCEICDQGFKWSYQLIRHALVHTKERPYKCLHCNKGFTTQSNLNRHIVMSKKSSC